MGTTSHIPVRVPVAYASFKRKGPYLASAAGAAGGAGGA
jgi:hypothetical protein